MIMLIINKTDLAGIKGIGKTIIDKFQEFKETGTLKAIEKEKENREIQFINKKEGNEPRPSDNAENY